MMDHDVITTNFPFNYASVSASYGIGQLCPIFTIVMPPLETQVGGVLNPYTLEHAWDSSKDIEDQLTGDVTFTIFNMTWTCSVTSASVSVSPDGFSKTIEFTPQAMVEQVYPGFGQDIFFYSMPLWIFNRVERDLDFDKIEAHFKESDDFPTNGFTREEIIKIISTYAGKEYIVSMPICHVSEKTVVYVAGTPYVKFIEDLLLPNLDHIFFISDDSCIISTIIPPEQTESYPEFSGESGAFSVQRKMRPAYDSLHFTGADGRPVLEDYGLDGVTYQTPDQIEIGEWHQENDTRGGLSVVIESRETTQLDPFGDPFCIKKYEEFVTAEVPKREDPETTVEMQFEETTTTYTYENDQSLYYEAPRLLKSTTETSGYGYLIYSGYHSTQVGVSYFLTDALVIITSTEYDELDTKPDIFLSACFYNADLLATSVHEMSYISPSAASMSRYLIEGSIIEDRENIQKYGSSVFARISVVDGEITTSRTRNLGWFPIDQPPQDVLSNIAVQLQDVSTITYVTVSNSLADFSYNKTSYRRLSSGMFDAMLEHGEYNQQTRTLDVQKTRNSIPGETIPASPTTFRKQRVQKKTGNFGEKQTITSTQVSIPTANRIDFEEISLMLEHKLMNEFEPITYDSVDKDDFVFPGYPFRDRTAVGFVVAWSPISGYEIAITAK